MSGPSLFDDFFSDQEEQDQMQDATGQNEILPQSIASIKQQLKEHYEKEANPKLPQEKHTHSAEEEAESYKQIEKEEENPVSNPEPKYLLTPSPENSFFEIEWSPAVPEFELDIAKIDDAPNKSKATSDKIDPPDLPVPDSEEVSTPLKQELTSPTAPITSNMENIKAYFEVEWPDNETAFVHPPQSSEKIEDDYSLEPSALEMLEAHLDSPSLDLEDHLPHNELIEEKSDAEDLIQDDVASLSATSKEWEVEDSLDPTVAQPIPQHISESALPEWNLQDKYYPIGEVAKLFEVNLSHIRYWTNEFKLKPRTTRRGERLYNLSDIQKLRMIYFLVKEQKHTIQGAKKHLRNNASAVVDQIELKASLLSFRQSLEAILNTLD